MIAARFSIVLLVGCGAACGRPAPPAVPDAAPVVPDAAVLPANRDAVDRLARAIDEQYSYRDRLGLDWKQLFAEHRAALETAASPEAFAREAVLLLAPAKDAHIWIDVGKQRLATNQPTAPPNVTLAALRRAVGGLTPRGPCLASGKLGADVGYLLVESLEHGKCDDLPAAFATALGELAGMRALVLDLRGNQGGDERIAAALAGRFIDKPLLYAKHEFRDQNAPGGFKPPYERVLQPILDGPRWRGPLVVLMGPLDMSSAEAFLLMLRAAGARLVGAQSRGASGNPQPVDLGNGVTVYLPSWRAMLPDGTYFEGVGLAPDVVVSDNDFSKRDPVIDAALATLPAPQ